MAAEQSHGTRLSRPLSQAQHGGLPTLPCRARRERRLRRRRLRRRDAALLAAQGTPGLGTRMPGNVRNQPYRHHLGATGAVVRSWLERAGTGQLGRSGTPTASGTNLHEHEYVPSRGKPQPHWSAERAGRQRGQLAQGAVEQCRRLGIHRRTAGDATRSAPPPPGWNGSENDTREGSAVWAAGTTVGMVFSIFVASCAPHISKRETVVVGPAQLKGMARDAVGRGDSATWR